MSEEIKPEVIETVTPDVVESKAAEEVPASAGQNPVTVEETPAAVEEAPAAIEEEAPATAVEEEAPAAAVEEAPAAEEEAPAAAAETVAEKVVNFSEKTLAELGELFQQLSSGVDKMTRSKEAEAIKAAFYRKLSKEKAEAGYGGAVDEPSENSEVTAPEAAPAEIADNPFAAIEAAFKSMYNQYKAERAEYNRRMEAERNENLVKKQAVIEDLKALVEEQGEMKDSFPKFRAIQARWRETGPVPQANFRDINDTYQLYVEKFYDLVQINRDLRDLDFRKNLEAKTEFCEQAEQLAASDDVVSAFKDLQKLHEQWKELGPVAKEYRDSIWERFRAATAVINRNYQSHFENLKSQQAENLKAKEALCEKVEEIASKEITSSSEWNALSKEIETIQAEWRTIGFATRKENQKIYDRFRAACDAFFERKRQYYSEFKDSMNDNMEKKLAIIQKAEALSTSTDWKATSDELIRLQQEWKSIGAVPRKKSEQLWKRFRAACDAFFNERDKHARPENNFHANLAAKNDIIAQMNAYELTGDEEADRAKGLEFQEAFNAVGFVPYKEKDAVSDAYRQALRRFPALNPGARRRSEGGRQGGGRQGVQRGPLTEKDRLMQQYQQLQQEVQTYENNIGFFGLSKGAEALKAQMQEKIDAAKVQLSDLMERIRSIESSEEKGEQE